MRTRLGGALALALAYGCGGSAQAPVHDASKAKPVASKRAEQAAPSHLPAHPLTRALEGTFGPYVGRGEKGALTLWATPTERGHRWMTLPLDAAGAPTGLVHDAGAAPDVPPRVVVRPMGEGFAAAFTYRVDLSSAVAVLVVSASGEPVGEAVIVTHSADPVLYADIVNLDTGAVLVYAVQKGDAAELLAIPLDRDGRPRGSGSVLASDAWAWQPISLGKTAALGMVVRAKDNAPGGQVAIARFDENGRALGSRTIVSEEASADPDLDAARVGDRIVLAWTDRRDLDSRVYVAAADWDGNVVTQPRPATAPRGDQAFLGLTASLPEAANPVALLAWEDLSQETTGPDLPANARAVRLGLVGADGMLRTRTATLALAGDEHAVPEFAAAEDGWIATTLAPACAHAEGCASAALAPTAVRFDRDLAVVSSEPLIADAFGRNPASLAWGLSCGGGHCTTLAAGSGAMAPVLAMEIPSRASAFLPAAKLDRRPAGPRALGWEALAAGDRLADLASTHLSGGSLVAWVTYFAEGEASAKAASSSSATVAVRALDERGNAASKPTTISVRAASVGGVAIAAGAPRDGDACLAWVGHDAGQLQVFATRVGKDGKKLAQQMITRTKGDVSDVAVAWAGDGWVLAWIDWRDGNGEVYATKIDRSLKRMLPERRLTNAAGDASNVQVLMREGEVWLAWADARGGGSAADPHTIRLRASDLQPLSAEVRVAASSLRSRALQLANLGDDVVLGWIEEADAEAVSGARTPGAKLVRLDARGGPLGIPQILPFEARPTSLALDCAQGRCRGIASIAENPGELRLDAFAWDGTTSRTAKVLTLVGSAADDVSPSLLGDFAFFADDDLRGQGRVRRMWLAWD